MFSDIQPPEKSKSWTSWYNTFIDCVANRTLDSFRHLQLDEKDSTTLKVIKIAGVALAGVAIVALLCWAIAKGSRMFRSPERIYPAESSVRNVTEELQTVAGPIVADAGTVVAETAEDLYAAVGTIVAETAEILRNAKNAVIEEATGILQSAKETVSEAVRIPPAPPGGMRRAGRY